MNTLGGDKKAGQNAEVKKVKVDAADVTLLCMLILNVAWGRRR